MAGRDRENAGRRGHPGALALAIARGNQSSMWRWRSMQAGRDNTVVGATAADLATETYLTASDVTSALSILERHGMVSPRPGPDGGTKGTDQIRVEIHAKATVGGLGCS